MVWKREGKTCAEALLKLTSEPGVSPIGPDNSEIKEKPGEDATWYIYRPQVEAIIAIFRSGCA